MATRRVGVMDHVAAAGGGAGNGNDAEEAGPERKQTTSRWRSHVWYQLQSRQRNESDKWRQRGQAEHCRKHSVAAAVQSLVAVSLKLPCEPAAQSPLSPAVVVPQWPG